MDKLCDICGLSMATETHHLICGTSERKLSDRYGLTIDICNSCHTEIHNNNIAGKLSKMLGQAMFEINFTHEEYMKWFKKNYLP